MKINRYAIGPYESHEAYLQAMNERRKLEAVAYLRTQDGYATIVNVAKAIGVTVTSAAYVIDSAPRTFKRRRIYNKKPWPDMVIELHPHVMEAG